MGILDNIKHDLCNHHYDNMIYTLDESETSVYEQVIELLKKDYGFLDIVLDFTDYDRIKPLFLKYPNAIPFIIEDYVYYSILSKANINIEDYDINSREQLEKMYNGEEFEILWIEKVLEKLKEKAKETENGEARVHFLFDNIDDVRLQQEVNALFYTRSGNVAFMGYHTKPLLSKCTTTGDRVDPVHDYIKVISDKARKTYSKKFERKIQKFERRIKND